MTTRGKTVSLFTNNNFLRKYTGSSKLYMSQYGELNTELSTEYNLNPNSQNWNIKFRKSCIWNDNDDILYNDRNTFKEYNWQLRILIIFCHSSRHEFIINILLKKVKHIFIVILLMTRCLSKCVEIFNFITMSIL